MKLVHLGKYNQVIDVVKNFAVIKKDAMKSFHSISGFACFIQISFSRVICMIQLEFITNIVE